MCSARLKKLGKMNSKLTNTVRIWLSGRNWSWLPPAICVAAATALWVVFFPGVMSFDSISQYKQAVTRQYTDWFPPIMSIVLTKVMALGGDVQHLVLLQCIAGVLGVYCLALFSIRLLFASDFIRRYSTFIALAVVSILMCPFSPLPVHLVVFWKDVWMLIGMMWLAAITILLLSQEQMSPILRGMLMASFLLAAYLTIAVRHNALVLLPLCCGLFAILASRYFSWRYAAVASVIPAIIYVGGQRFVASHYRVQHNTISSCEMTIDLMRICIRHPEAKSSLQFVAKYLPDDVQLSTYADIYAGTDLNQYFTSDPASFDPKEVAHDYWSCARQHPLWFAEIKLTAFLAHFTDSGGLRVLDSMQPNDYGLTFSGRWSGVRQFFWSSARSTFDRPILRFLFAQHAVWFIVALGCFVWFSIAWKRTGKTEDLAFAILMVFPISYSLSYFVFSPCADFRYMYPSTIFMQTIGGAMLMCCLILGIQNFWLSINQQSADRLLGLKQSTASHMPIKLTVDAQLKRKMADTNEI